MRYLDKYTLLPDAIKRIKFAAPVGIWDGKEETQYFIRCKWQLDRYPCIVIFTRDVGYHSSGWWRNPDYERCWHLSISFPGGKDKSILNKIIDGLFGAYKNLIWVEPPYSEVGKKNDVWHYRLFCDGLWQPIKPRGEVYSTQFTEYGWKSFSELNEPVIK